MTPLPELVVFDFAGTTMREEGAVLAAYRRVLGAHGVTMSDDDLAARRGAEKRAVFRELAGRPVRDAASDARAERMLADFEAALAAEYTRPGAVQPVDGAEAVVSRLRAHGVRVALTSGFSRALLGLLLERLGWAALFDVALAGEDAVAGRPAPFLIYQAMMRLDVRDVARVAVVGDTLLDLAAGENARAGWVIGVLSGAHDAATLGAARHTHLVASVAELPRLFSLG